MPIDLIDRISPKNAGNFPMMLDAHLLGGWRVVTDISGRDAITAERRTEGMRVKVESDGKVYELLGGITNGDWSEVIASVPGSVQATTESFSIPVDYDDAGTGSVGDPPVGTVFTSQADVDDMLTDNGWTAFKHLSSVCEALASLRHEVFINLAAGVHRPRVQPGYIAFTTDVNFLNGGGLQIKGPDPSSWDVVEAVQSIASLQVGSRNPYVTVAGTPYAGKDVKGFFALFDTGQLSPIHQVSGDNTLYVMNPISPAGPTTVTIVRPATILRNSLNDTSYANFMVLGSFSFLPTIGLPFGTQPGVAFNFKNLTVDPFGCNFGIYFAYLRTLEFTQCILDFQSFTEPPFSRPNNNNAYPIAIASGGFTFRSVTVRVSPAGTCRALAIIGGNDQRCSVRFHYFYARRAGGLWPNNSYFQIIAAVFDECNGVVGEPAVYIHNGTYWDAVDANPGKSTTFRGRPGSVVPGMVIDGSGQFRPDGQLVVFENHAGPCVQLRGGVSVDIRKSAGTVGIRGMNDGGGNLDVGIDMNGLNSSIEMNKGTDVTGTVGDVRLKDGTIVSYATIVASTPLLDAGYNVLAKDP